MIKYGIVILFTILFLTGCAGTPDKITSPGKSDIIPPMLLNRPEFIYPKKAQEKGIQGDVHIFIYITETGKVTESKIINSSKHEMLDEAARQYVKEMKFKPAFRNDKAIGIWISYKIQYTFESEVGDFQIKSYLVDFSNDLNAAETATGNDRDQFIQDLILRHEQYCIYVKENPGENYNQNIAVNLSRATIDKWGKFFQNWPLTFILYYDLIARFPKSGQIESVQDHMMNQIYDDLIRAEKIDQSETIKMQKSVQFAQALKSYLNKDYQDDVPEFLAQELDRLITLY